MVDRVVILAADAARPGLIPLVGLGGVQRGQPIAKVADGTGAGKDVVRAPDHGIVVQWLPGGGATGRQVAVFAFCAHAVLHHDVCTVCQADEAARADAPLRPALTAATRLARKSVHGLRASAAFAGPASSGAGDAQAVFDAILASGRIERLPEWDLDAKTPGAQPAAAAARARGYREVKALSGSSLSVAAHEVERVDTLSQGRLLASRRLCLVLDVDHTLLHATCDERAAVIAEHCGMQSFDGGDSTYFIKPRPAVRTFLRLCSSLFELSVDTAGTRAYAEEAIRVLDPDGALFGRRIVTRSDHDYMRTQQKAAHWAHRSLGDASMMLVVDDTATVWDQTAPGNLVQVEPYEFFGAFDDVNNSAGASATGSPTPAAPPAPQAAPPPKRARPAAPPDDGPLPSTEELYAEMGDVLGGLAAAQEPAPAQVRGAAALAQRPGRGRRPAAPALAASLETRPGRRGVDPSAHAPGALDAAFESAARAHGAPPRPLQASSRSTAAPAAGASGTAAAPGGPGSPTSAPERASPAADGSSVPPQSSSSSSSSSPSSSSRKRPRLSLAPSPFASRILATTTEEQLPVLADVYAVLLWAHHAYFRLPSPPPPHVIAHLFLVEAVRTGDWPGPAHDLCAPPSLLRARPQPGPGGDDDGIESVPAHAGMAPTHASDWKGRVARGTARVAAGQPPTARQPSRPLDSAVLSLSAPMGWPPHRHHAPPSLPTSLPPLPPCATPAPASDARACLAARLAWTLSGTRLLLTGVFPHTDDPWRHAVVRRAARLGAVVLHGASPDEHPTHIVAGRGVTERVHRAAAANRDAWKAGRARAGGEGAAAAAEGSRVGCAGVAAGSAVGSVPGPPAIAVVTVEWLRESLRRYRRMPESLFPLPGLEAHAATPYTSPVRPADAPFLSPPEAAPLAAAAVPAAAAAVVASSWGAVPSQSSAARGVEAALRASRSGGAVSRSSDEESEDFDLDSGPSDDDDDRPVLGGVGSVGVVPGRGRRAEGRLGGGECAIDEAILAAQAASEGRAEGGGDWDGMPPDGREEDGTHDEDDDDDDDGGGGADYD